MVHENSTKSYEEQKASGSVESWRRRVYEAFRSSEHPRTDRSIMEQFKVTDANLVRPEITRLIRDRILQEEGKTKCMWTGKTVRTCVTTGNPYFEKGNKKGTYES
jgi:hypothetical protein